MTSKFEKSMAIAELASSLLSCILGELLSGTSLEAIKEKRVKDLLGFRSCEKRIMKLNIPSLIKELSKYKAR